MTRLPSFRAILIWTVLAAALVVPIAVAVTSPLLAWRQPVYIVAGLAGVVALALLLLQPLLAAGYLPGLRAGHGRRAHAWIGSGLTAAVGIHVAGLWLTSPPDVIDALLFRSPTPFSAWGVIAMWAVFAAALLAALRRRLRVRQKVWRLIHTTLAMVVVLGSVIHALLIEGTMGMMSKSVLCALVVAAVVKAIFDTRSQLLPARRKA
ncbi:ferric reductase-like transmembrane domain-containing protein [Skermanella sp. TT6]|uniref:Ferric reductase-like transmembrane domain-containing protein n=1 Tax=Skermanella cutis TaxID=2775420 RepID=A0ABX7BCR0_9PROT|nr:ferric reductase-like transmembrane domain-containing protein [Skermanella sp. TT6]QQP92200.1 ferric reductase-like transmembrane domain-containing protein [Skermanella sp. TT6]